MPATRKSYVDAGGGQVHLRQLASHRETSPAPLMCLHPAPSSGLYFTTVMPLLNERRDVLAPDYPGYGGSDPLSDPPSIASYAKAMLAVRDALAPDVPIDVLGFHTGCLVACEMALQAPDSVRRLVLCDIPYFTGDVQAQLREQMSAPLPVTPQLDSLAGAWKFNIESRIDDVLMERALELFAEHLRAGTRDAQGFAAAFSYDCEERFGRLDADVTVLATQSGLRDATLAAADVIPGASLVNVSEVTTAVFESGAEAISRRILEALDERK